MADLEEPTHFEEPVLHRSFIEECRLVQGVARWYPDRAGRFGPRDREDVLLRGLTPLEVATLPGFDRRRYYTEWSVKLDPFPTRQFTRDSLIRLLEEPGLPEWGDVYMVSDRNQAYLRYRFRDDAAIALAALDPGGTPAQ